MAKHTPIFAADIKGGVLNFHQEGLYLRHIEALEGKRVKVTIKEFKAGDSVRSTQANAYYWAVVIDILRFEFGYEKEEMHDALGIMFRRDYTKVIPTIIRTSTMSSSEFWDYIERVRIWAATNYGVNIPDPNSVE